MQVIGGNKKTLSESRNTVKYGDERLAAIIENKLNPERLSKSELIELINTSLQKLESWYELARESENYKIQYHKSEQVIASLQQLLQQSNSSVTILENKLEGYKELMDALMFSSSKK